ncbi:dispanin subfamily A member 2b-like [Dendropsophus ebraccatus]|uniref:dispanin subfamily A member 2b-like n=1 Tax=Dendropsophus ebraccatus TaxID=150705 RepID=UPI0038320B0E
MEGEREVLCQPRSMVLSIQAGTLLHPSPPKDYLVWSIVNLIFCCLPLAVAALIFSIKTRDANHQNNADLATEYSSTAEGLNAAATVIGIFLNVVLFIVYFMYPSLIMP